MHMEQIIHRARAVLAYIPDPLAAMVYLHNEGCSPTDAFLAVKAALILGK
jgi:hypothetical protein